MSGARRVTVLRAINDKNLKYEIETVSNRCQADTVSPINDKNLKYEIETRPWAQVSKAINDKNLKYEIETDYHYISHPVSQ